MMQEANANSPVVLLRRQILEAQEKLKTLTAAAERKAEQTRLSELHTKLAIKMEAFRKYG